MKRYRCLGTISDDTKPLSWLLIEDALFWRNTRATVKTVSHKDFVKLVKENEVAPINGCYGNTLRFLVSESGDLHIRGSYGNLLCDIASACPQFGVGALDKDVISVSVVDCYYENGRLMTTVRIYSPDVFSEDVLGIAFSWFSGLWKLSVAVNVLSGSVSFDALEGFLHSLVMLEKRGVRTRVSVDVRTLMSYSNVYHRGTWLPGEVLEKVTNQLLQYNSEQSVLADSNFYMRRFMLVI